MRPPVHVVVLNWNGLEHTLACLESLSALDGGMARVLVVDNGSKVSPRAAIEREHPGVAVVENPVNLGYSGGNNVGLSRALDAGASFVWVLNNDTAVDPEALGELMAVARRHPRAGAVGGKVLRADHPQVLWMTWGRVTWLQSLIALVGQGRPDTGAYDSERQVPWLPGCSILFRAEALREVGLFDEEFFAYHEDVDWAARARKAGWELWYTGKARVRHSAHASSGGEASYVGFRKYLSARNSVLYARRHGRPWQVALLVASILVTLPFQYTRRWLSGEQEGIALKMRGWRDGLLGRPLPLVELGLR